MGHLRFAHLTGYNGAVLKQTHLIAGLWCFVCVLTVLILFRGIGVAQTSSPAFWELLPEKVDAMLFSAPNDNKVRYARLREYFSDLHCTATAMEEQVVLKHGKNLICTLPGKDAEQIVVAARYERRDRLYGLERGWNDAVMLALLYNALRAELRQHTFVFVELSGGLGRMHSLKVCARSAARRRKYLSCWTLSGSAIPGSTHFRSFR